VCSVCSVVKKNGIGSSLKDGTGNADVPRAALRFALGYLILPLWGGDTTTLSRRDCPGFSPQSGTIVASPRLRHVARVASFRCVGSSSSSPSPCWRQLDTAARQPRIRSYRRRSRTLRRGSVEAQGRSGNCECHGLRGARPLAQECSFDSFPNRFFST